MNIDGIPESITEAQLQDLIRSLGIEVNNVTQASGVTLGWNAITCTVYATGPDGLRYLDQTGEAVAVHHVSIPVIHPG